MVSIAYGLNTSTPGQRFWLAGAPGVSDQLWSLEDCYPPTAERVIFEEHGAGWPVARHYDLGNAAVKWTFSTHLVLRSSAEVIEVLHRMTDACIYSGILEHWVPLDDSTYQVWRSDRCALQVKPLHAAGTGMKLQFTASYGKMTMASAPETPAIQRLGDGLGNALVDSSGNYLTLGYGFRPWF